jgi:putative transposase
MARMPRIAVPGYPHHLTQRGNRRQQTFFCDDDYRYYIELLSGYARMHNRQIPKSGLIV